MSQNKITIVITSYKSEEKILSCLESVNLKYKVIIIENSTNQDFKKKIEKKYTNVECVIAGENLGYAKGNNLGLSKVKTEYALILNPDAILEKNTIENFLITANKIRTFAIIAPAVQESNDKKKIASIIEVKSVKGFAMFFNIKEFKNIGFFDKNIFIYLEEIDLCKRLKKRKEKIFIVKKSKIKHLAAKSSNIGFEFEKCRNWHWMWSKVYYDIKYKNYFYAIKKVFFTILLSYIKGILFLLLDKDKSTISFLRSSGAMNALIGNKSWYRPKINNIY